MRATSFVCLLFKIESVENDAVLSLNREDAAGIVILIVPVASVRFTAINILIALVVTVYTSMIIGPGVYASLLEMREMNRKAVLSRNDTVNKEIKKKVRKATKETSLDPNIAKDDIVLILTFVVDAKTFANVKAILTPV